MAHKADTKAFQKKGVTFSHHVVHQGFAVAGFQSEDHANDDAKSRNARGAEFGVQSKYTVAPASDAEFV